jgi:murein DD-endopeptidase MepM/ murein hydrolase activator NlpD
VRRFQTSANIGVDGKVGPDTWGRLNRPPGANANGPAPPVAQQPSAPATTGEGDFCFPLAQRPSPDWKSGARYFGARRSGGTRLHAGCDLLGPRGTAIYAISDGVLVREPYYFYSGTYAVELRHGPYLIRYGEILGGSYVGGRQVRKGQLIARIGRLNSGSSMLHFEMYSNGSSTARLTTGTGPYKRRADVINPSPHLDAWLANLPGR